MPYTDATPPILKRAVNLTLDDEIACVLSLVAGVRLRSGGLVRRFEKEDSRGTPQFYAHVAPDSVATQRPATRGRPFLVFPLYQRTDPVHRIFDQYGDGIMNLILLFAATAIIGIPTATVWLLGRRAKVPSWMLTVFLLAGWLTVLAGWALSQRAQPFLFPETSPCYDTSGTPVSQYFPPDSFCRHADGELRTVNGANSKLMFWSAANTTLAVMIGAAFLWRHQRSRS